MKKDYVDQLNKVFAVQEQILDIQPFLEENENRDLGEVMGGRRWLKSFLSEGDFEYMVWQEWKEGFARLIENQIRRRMGLPENFRGKEQPFDRVVFYVDGANFIEHLGRQAPQLLIDIESLFDRMIREKNCGLGVFKFLLIFTCLKESTIELAGS